MPAHVQPTSALEAQLLVQFGARLKGLRLARGLAVSSLARDLGVSRTTIYAVEAGDPSVTIGTYVRVMGALGTAADMALLATDVARTCGGPLPLDEALDSHRRQDLRSLALHKEAVKVLRKDPGRVQRALDVLKRWDGIPDPNAQPLMDEWRKILEAKDWARAVADTQRGRQLRQASPLVFVLDEATRKSIMARFSKAALREPVAA